MKKSTSNIIVRPNLVNHMCKLVDGLFMKNKAKFLVDSNLSSEISTFGQPKRQSALIILQNPLQDKFNKTNFD